MNRIILDHLRRWWWVWLIIAIANGFMAGVIVENLSTFKGFGGLMFPLLIWAGAMQLNFDLQRGAGRALVTLPVSVRQVGKAWWIFSVALPALLLTTTTGIGLIIYSIFAKQGFQFQTLLLTSLANTLCLGAMFTLFVGEIQGRPQNAIAWLRRILSTCFIITVIIVQPSLTDPAGIFVLLMGLILTLSGWFRSEQMVVQRATFRPGIQFGKRTPGQHRAPSGFGGLPFLVQTQVIQFIRFALLFTAIMMLLPLIQGRSLNHSLPQMFHAALPALASFGGIFTFMFLMLPVLLQLRHLRTLPISVSALAALLVFIPVAPVLIAGTVFNLATGNFPSSENFLPFPIQCLTYAAAMTIAVPLLVCQGMGSGSFVGLVLGMVATMMAPVLFPWLKVPLPVSALISTTVIALSFLFTRRLLKSSSQAYRPLLANMAAWGGGR